MFKFIQVNQEKKESKLNKTTQEKTIKTFYENHYYKIIKEERDVIYSDHNSTLSNIISYLFFLFLQINILNI